MKGTGLILLLFLAISCKSETESKTILPPRVLDNFNDSAFVSNDSFPYGDIRRYGIFPEQTVPQNELQKLFQLAHQGVPLFFPAGYYPISLRIEGGEDISIHFEKVELGGELFIIEAENRNSSRISLKGNLRVMDRVFVRHSGDISMDTLLIHSDQKKNINGKKNRGLSIYAGSRNILIQYLEVFDAGGEPTKYYQYSAAAVQLHGWNNNPKNVRIGELKIRNAGRSGIYLTGNGHRIGKLEISGFGSGSNQQMAGLDDAPAGSARSFTGLWLNKCDNCELDSVRILNGDSEGFSELRLDPGEAFKPVIIHNLLIKHELSEPNIEDSELTNVIIKNVIRDDADH
ncbi:hypothetical protein ACT6NV_05960 [Robiginitalea sp. IMCC44478]|uniref:hypothetical protein n=1 Tax=Robiginitalea sp. IMCC44478 TaxID=3459122 RepID=UPI004040ED46